MKHLTIAEKVSVDTYLETDECMGEGNKGKCYILTPRYKLHEFFRDSFNQKRNYYFLKNMFFYVDRPGGRDKILNILYSKLTLPSI